MNESYSFAHNVWFGGGYLPESTPVRDSDSAGSDSARIIGKKPFSPGLEISSMYYFDCAMAESHFANSPGGPS